MARKKLKKEEVKEEKIVSSQDKLSLAKAKRKKAWEEKQSKSGSSTIKEREEFRKFFAKVKTRLRLEKSMEEVIWLHFKAAGFDRKEEFNKGLEHFGYKL